MLRRVPGDRDHVALTPRDHHTQRIDLIDAGVVGVGCSIQGLKIELPIDDSPEVVIYPSPALVHGGDRTSSLIASSNSSCPRVRETVGRPISGAGSPHSAGSPSRRAGSAAHLNVPVRHASGPAAGQSADAPRSRNCWARIRSWRYRSPIARSKGWNRPSPSEPAPRTWHPHR